MLQTIEATIGRDGDIRLAEPVKLAGRRRALVTILDEEVGLADPKGAGEAALLSEATLAEGWDTREEDEAWAHLQDLPPDPSLQEDERPQRVARKGGRR